jgi:N-dimethylarginine dimethylaminohydrolase
LIQDTVKQFWENRLPFEGIESNHLYLPRCPHPEYKEGHEEWLQLPKYLENEGVKVFELTQVLDNILSNATGGERRDMVNKIWGESHPRPKADELNIEHLLWGYPPKPLYDGEADRVILPDFRRVAWPYPRDTSFTTPIGTVICNMRRYSRHYEPDIVKLAYEYHSQLEENIEIVFDANSIEGIQTEPPSIEGGDTQVIDEETLAIGIGQRTTLSGFKETATKLFDSDPDGDLTHIYAVKLADYPAKDYMHLDVTINWVDHVKPLVMPYFYESDILDDAPSKQLLLKLLQALRAQSKAHGRPLTPMVPAHAFRDAGNCTVYRNRSGKAELVRNRDNFLDLLIMMGKVEKDEIIWVGGELPEGKDIDHLFNCLMEQAQGATNIFAIQPCKVISYQRNKKTNEELRRHGVKVLEWSDAYLDLLGGPHCSTNPLSREKN